MKEIRNFGIKVICNYVCSRYPEAVGVVYWKMDNDLVMVCGVSQRGNRASDIVIIDLSGKIFDKERVIEAGTFFKESRLAVDKVINQGICFLHNRAPNDRLQRSICRKVFGTVGEFIEGEPERF